MARLTLFEFLREQPTPEGAVTEDDVRKNTVALSDALRSAWEQSPFAPARREELHEQLVFNAVKTGLKEAGITAPEAVIENIFRFVSTLIDAEPFFTTMLSPMPPGLTYAELLEERARLLEMRKVLENPELHIRRWQKMVGRLIAAILDGMPSVPEGMVVSTTELLSLKSDVAGTIDRVYGIMSESDGEELYRTGFLRVLWNTLMDNVREASGISDRDRRPQKDQKLIPASKQRNMSGEELVDAYFAGTELLRLFILRWPITIPESTRFEHHWIVAGSGHGKTQTLQYLIGQDLERVVEGEASVIVIDSQGDLIHNIAGLKAFAAGGELDGRLCLIDPTDLEYPVALNLFDVAMKRINTYSALDRERLINSVLELYDFLIGTLLAASFTAKQGTVFKYILRLMLSIPGANIQTLRQLMEPSASARFAPYIGKLTGTARAFFDNEFNGKQFEDTKRQVARRLYGILENQTFERMFSHPQNKLDLFSEMNAGRVILINTAKELLKQTGTEILGRFFIAMIAQAAQERATLPKEKRLPCFVYIDECQDYVDANVGLILEQARKFNVGLILAHQYVGQLDNKLQESFSANTSIKFAGGVSDKDARALSHMLRTTPEFIESQRKGSFAAFIRNVTDRGLSLQFPFGYLEQFPRATEAEFAKLRDRMRERYAVHHSEVEQVISEHVGGVAAPKVATPHAGQTASGTARKSHTVPATEEKDVTKASKDWGGEN
jgi:hypothetical protein